VTVVAGSVGVGRPRIGITGLRGDTVVGADCVATGDRVATGEGATAGVRGWAVCNSGVLARGVRGAVGLAVPNRGVAATAGMARV
jgi:hypothetical protein